MYRVKQLLPDAKIWRLGRPGKLRFNETENVFLSWLGWLYFKYFDGFSILPAFPCKTAVAPRTQLSGTHATQAHAHTHVLEY
jgi:hypothetical protein